MAGGIKDRSCLTDPTESVLSHTISELVSVLLVGLTHEHPHQGGSNRAKVKKERSLQSTIPPSAERGNLVLDRTEIEPAQRGASVYVRTSGQRDKRLAQPDFALFEG